jgi:hypothetical protein
MLKNKRSIADLLLIILLGVSPIIVSRGVSARVEAGAYGVMFFYTGAYVLMTWRGFVEQLIAQQPKHDLLGRWFGGRSTYSEKGTRIFCGILMRFLGVLFIIGGSLMLYTFITGRDWPLHHARWSDLWPF